MNDETAKAAAKGMRERRGMPILELFEEHMREGIRQGDVRLYNEQETELAATVHSVTPSEDTQSTHGTVGQSAHSQKMSIG